MRHYLDHFHEPVSALTHLVAAVAALGGLGLLLARSWGDRPMALALLVYGGSLVLLYAASAAFHGLKLPDEQRLWLNRLDHLAIFLLIAGTYTPIIYRYFPAGWKWGALLTVWLLALTGMAYKLFSRRLHGLLNTAIYPALSWGAAVPAVVAYHGQPFIPAGGLRLILAGGLIYTAGFVVYYRQRPDPWPGVLGHHEIWHLFVIAGSLCHYLFMWRYLA